jgi:hypothetical protein
MRIDLFSKVVKRCRFVIGCFKDGFEASLYSKQISGKVAFVQKRYLAIDPKIVYIYLHQSKNPTRLKHDCLLLM